jgi:hypothetical protein
MHINYSQETPEHLILVLKRRRATVLAATIAGLVVALALGIAMVTLMYR